jgi:hypothetical protein
MFDVLHERFSLVEQSNFSRESCRANALRVDAL